MRRDGDLGKVKTLFDSKSERASTERKREKTPQINSGLLEEPKEEVFRATRGEGGVGTRIPTVSPPGRAPDEASRGSLLQGT